MLENDFILLLQIYSHRQLNENELILQLGMTKSQFNYRLSKINDWLTRNKLGIINRNGKQIVFDENLSDYIEILDFKNLPISHLDQESRVVLIFLIIVISRESLSLNHLSQYISVSRNTTLMDLKVLKEDLILFNLDLEYSRSEGYGLSGDEFDIRRFVEYYIDKLPNPHLIAKELSVIEPSISRYLETFKDFILHVENEVDTHYSDRVIESSPLLLYVVNQRILKGRFVDTSGSEMYEDLTNSDEYKIIERLASLYFDRNINHAEILFITLYFLSINKMDSRNKPNSIQKSDLQEAIMTSLNLFENSSTIIIDNKEMLVELLSTHLSAAFYRYRYTIRSSYQINISSQMRQDLEEIYYFVSRSIYPIEVVMNLELPDDEIFFIASYIGGHIRAQTFDNSRVDSVISAIVICENGIIYSNILINSLRQMFDNIKFLRVMSIRDYYAQQEDLQNVDIVFSSKYLTTTHDLVVVNSFDREEESRIIKEVNEIIKSKGHFSSSVVGDVMSLIPNVLPEEIRKQVQKDLENYFKVNEKSEVISKVEELGIMDVLNENNIIILDKPKTWTAILKEVGDCFVREGHIDNERLDQLIGLYPEPTLEILFGGTVLVPHIRVDGTVGFKLKLIILETPILLEGISIKILLIMIAGDGESHVRTVYELHQLSMSPAIREIMEMRSSKEIIKKLASLDFNEKGREVKHDR